MGYSGRSDLFVIQQNRLLMSPDIESYISCVKANDSSKYQIWAMLH